jgi:glycyl-tRNA synthetase alpha subunit
MRIDGRADGHDEANFANAPKNDYFSTQYLLQMEEILPHSSLVRDVRWCETDVSRLPVCPVFLEDEPDIPKRRFHITSHSVITHKTEEFSSTAAEAYDIAEMECLLRGKNSIFKCNSGSPKYWSC